MEVWIFNTCLWCSQMTVTLFSIIKSLLTWLKYLQTKLKKKRFYNHRYFYCNWNYSFKNDDDSNYFPCNNWVHLSIITADREREKNELNINNNLLTLFKWMGLLSSTGSTAAALTLNTTPMRAANTTRSCMLWQECRWLTRATVTGAGGSQRHRECVTVCLSARVWAAQTCWKIQRRMLRKVERSWWQLLRRFGNPRCFFSSASKAPHSFICLSSPPTPHPLVCHWRSRWWVYDGGCMCACCWGGVYVSTKEEERWRGQDTTNGTI